MTSSLVPQSPQYAKRVRACQALGVHCESGMVFDRKPFERLTVEAKVRQKSLCNALDKDPSKMFSQKECVPLGDWPQVSRLTRVGLHLGPSAWGAWPSGRPGRVALPSHKQPLFPFLNYQPLDGDQNAKKGLIYKPNNVVIAPGHQVALLWEGRCFRLVGPACDEA